MNIYLALFSLWHTLFFAPSPQMIQGIIHGNTASGSPVAPTFVSADSNQYNEVGTLFTFDTITTSSGNLLWVVGGMRASGDCAQLTIASFIGGSASGDSWTKI